MGGQAVGNRVFFSGISDMLQLGGLLGGGGLLLLFRMKLQDSVISH